MAVIEPIASARLRGAEDARAGHQPSPPLSEDRCRAYWEGYREERAAQKKGRAA
jgi:hypothetical protein